MRATEVPPAATQAPRVETALRELARSVGEGLPPLWQSALRRAAGVGSPHVSDQVVAAALVVADLGLDKRRTWWGAVERLHWLLVAAALIGLGSP